MAILSRTPSIYQIRHIESGKVYVGSAVDPRKRQCEHLRTLRNGKHHSQYLQRTWDKYGEDAFVFEIIEPVLFIEDLIAREQYWIDALYATDPKYGFNTSPTAGSTLGVKQTDETRAANAARAKAQFADPAQRVKASEGQKARMSNPAERANLSQRATAQWADPANRDRRSEQTKAYFADPVKKARHEARRKEWMADPAYRAKRSVLSKAQMEARYADPLERAKQSERMKALCADPVLRAKRAVAGAKGGAARARNQAARDVIHVAADEARDQIEHEREEESSDIE